jgi:nucleotidyltransferase substrate binding protein (TIGR01987 family)
MSELDSTSLKNAVSSLEETLHFIEERRGKAFQKELDILRAAAIQNFEVAYEQCWKFMKRWLEINRGVSESDVFTKKELFRYCAEAGLLSDSVIWFEFNKSRNKSAHTYNPVTAEEVFETAKDFLASAQEFLERLERRL